MSENQRPALGVWRAGDLEMSFDVDPGERQHLAALFASALAVAFRDDARGVTLYRGDCLGLMDALAPAHPDGLFDSIVTDPPYFLSNGGTTCQAGKRVAVAKGAWDASKGVEENHAFNRAWLAKSQALLRPNGTIWVSGTHHVIHSVGFAMQQLGFKILNEITWEKPNPPPNLSCRYFTHATETLLWAAKSPAARHTFHYEEMRRQNGGTQMKTVWRFLAPPKAEKVYGKHPTQKPLALMARVLLASTNEGDLVFDPFAGSATTGVAAVTHGRRFVGCELDPDHAALAAARLAAALREPRLDVTPRPRPA